MKIHCIRFVPFLEGGPTSNFERFGAYLAAFLPNFPKNPKRTNFFPLWWISEEASNAVNFYLFFKVVANFKFIFLSHFSTNSERFGPYPAAFMLNFPKHTNFFPFWWISKEFWPFLFRSTFFWARPVVRFSRALYLPSLVFLPVFKIWALFWPYY